MTETDVSPRVYTVVFISLLVLLAISAAAAHVNLGHRTNTALALGISVVKTVLIVLFFMHVYYSSALTRLIAIGGLLWLGILMVLTFSDYQTRTWNSIRWSEYEARTLDRVRPALEQLELKSQPAVQAEES